MAGDTFTLTTSGVTDALAALDRLTADAPERLDMVADDAADMIAGRARSKVPTRSGRARRSVATRREQGRAQVVGGGSVAPYFPWLDFGGRVGRRRAIDRPYVRDGRYIFPAHMEARDDMTRRLEVEVRAMAADAGWEVT